MNEETKAQKKTIEVNNVLKGICPVCNEIFDFPIKGNKVFCSGNCASKNWGIVHKDRRRECGRKWGQKPENKLKKQAYTRRTKLKQRYGLTEDDVELMLHRQNYSCFGCLKRIDLETARIDHDHETNKVRGLLCDNCNWVLGHVYDNPETMRRLMAYLDRDKNKLFIYLTGALKNELRIPEIGNVLREQGWDVMDEWITPGEHADENWQRYEKIRGRTYKQALHGRAATNIFLFDKSYLDMADVIVLIMPCGKSGFMEAGYAKGRNKKVIMFLDGKDPERYDVMPNFANKVCKNIEDLIEELKKIRI